MTSPLLGYLQGLAENNNKAWFEEHRGEYQGLRQEFTSLVGEILARLAVVDPAVEHLRPADCLFRINRDVRFSRDKSPYKTQFSALFCPQGRNVNLPSYYFHVAANGEEGGELLAGGGMYAPEPAASGRRPPLYPGASLSPRRAVGRPGLCRHGRNLRRFAQAAACRCTGRCAPYGHTAAQTISRRRDRRRKQRCAIRPSRLGRGTFYGHGAFYPVAARRAWPTGRRGWGRETANRHLLASRHLRDRTSCLYCDRNAVADIEGREYARGGSRLTSNQPAQRLQVEKEHAPTVHALLLAGLTR